MRDLSKAISVMKQTPTKAHSLTEPRQRVQPAQASGGTSCGPGPLFLALDAAPAEGRFGPAIAEMGTLETGLRFLAPRLTLGA